MRVELTGFSQGVSFEEKGAMINYLDFRKDDGSSFRIPVPEESMQVLLKEVYENGQTKQAAPAPEPEPLPEGAEEFGGDFEPGQEEPEVAPEEEPEDPYVEQGTPESEDDVPSI
jgi:hypothetical protein